MGNGIYRRPLWSCMKKGFGCTWKKHNRTEQVSTSLSVAAMLPHPSMNDTPSHFEQNAVLPHPVHFFHVLIFHFRKQIISWRMYGVIAKGFDHSLDHLDTWKPFAFSHTNKCLLATDSLRHLVRWGNTMLPHQVPYRVRCLVRTKCDPCSCYIFHHCNILHRMIYWCVVRHFLLNMFLIAIPFCGH